MTMRNYFNDSCELSPGQLAAIDLCMCAIVVLAIVIVIALAVQ